MAKHTIEVYDCIAISINCERNDPVDIRCGGPATLGYDFLILSEEDIEDTVSFIKKQLKLNNQPFMSYNIARRKVPKEALWNRDKISECIKGGY